MQENPLTSRLPQEREKRPRRSRSGIGWWVTDQELYEILGVPEETARVMISDLDKNHATSGFPQKQAQWGGRRFQPALEEWFKRVYGLKMQSSNLRRVG